MVQAVTQTKCSDIYVRIRILLLKQGKNKMQSTERFYAFDLAGQVQGFHGTQ